MKTDWATVLAHAMAGEPEKVPPGWQTTDQIAAELGISTRAARERVRCALKSGIVERREFRIPAAGTVRPVPHYRPVKGK